MKKLVRILSSFIALGCVSAVVNGGVPNFVNADFDGTGNLEDRNVEGVVNWTPTSADFGKWLCFPIASSYGSLYLGNESISPSLPYGLSPQGGFYLSSRESSSATINTVWQIVQNNKITQGVYEISFNYINPSNNLKLQFAVYGFNQSPVLTMQSRFLPRTSQEITITNGMLLGGGEVPYSSQNYSGQNAWMEYSSEIDFGAGYDYLMIGFTLRTETDLTTGVPRPNGVDAIDGISFTASTASDEFTFGWYDSVNNSSSMYDMIDEGANTTLCYGTNTASFDTVKEWLDNAQACGMKAVLEIPRDDVENRDGTAILAFVNALDDYPAVVGWRTYDEPDTDSDSIGDCEYAYDLIKTVSDKPVSIVFFRKDHISPFDDAFDEFEFDAYPCGSDDVELEGFEDYETGFWPFITHHDGWISKIDDVSQIAVNLGKPWTSVIQGYGRQSESNSARLPTYGEERFMTYYSIQKDSADLMYWAHYRLVQSIACPTDPYPYSWEDWIGDVWTPIANELKTCGPAIEAGEIVGGVTSSASGVGATIYQDPDNDIYYLIAIDLEGDEPGATFTLNLPDTIVAAVVLSEDETIAVSSQSFTDNYFSPYGVHVYELLTADQMSFSPNFVNLDFDGTSNLEDRDVYGENWIPGEFDFGKWLCLPIASSFGSLYIGNNSTSPAQPYASSSEGGNYLSSRETTNATINTVWQIVKNDKITKGAYDFSFQYINSYNNGVKLQYAFYGFNDYPVINMGTRFVPDSSSDMIETNGVFLGGEELDFGSINQWAQHTGEIDFHEGYNYLLIGFTLRSLTDTTGAYARPNGVDAIDGLSFTPTAPTTLYFSPEGFETTDVTKDIVITCEDSSAVIRYTVDGTDPSETHGTVIQSGGTVTLAQTTTLKALAWSDGVAGAIRSVDCVFVEIATGIVNGDANGDGMVDVGDLGILAANYGTPSGATWAQGDFNGDGAVDVGDLGILAANYGTETSGADFDTDYARVFDETADDDDAESSICSVLGLPLVGGLLLSGLVLMIKPGR